MFRTSRSSVAAVVLFAASPALAGELVFNGGFQSGFSGWSVPPNVPNQSHFVVSSQQGGGPNSSHYAVMSSTNQQFISQVLPTQAGQNYELSFWLRWTSPLSSAEQVTVRWEGQPVLHIPATFQPVPWTRYSVPLHANITGSFLEFGQAVFPGEFHIDDISVVPIPTPSAAPLLLLGSAVALRRRRR